MTSVRIGNWKGVRPKTDAPWELFDLGADIEETRNLAAEHPRIVERMNEVATREHVPQSTAGVFDRELNAKDLQSVYPGRSVMGADPGAGRLPPR
jgi:hypothetical protein